MHLLMPDALSGWTEESRTALRSTCPSEGKLALYEAIHGRVPHYFRALIHYSIVRQTTATIAQSHLEIRLKNVFAGNIMAWALLKLVQLCLLPSSAPALWLSNEI
ncbi:hypothetical protein FOMG_14519 [Fusarium oxysporum f. sp. melonis 26406]|uniref:Uncharacterized protein n=1 Tax=Fusarium oxysporum f. sp. melonis 26406 TaxID=1089452 RepID=W9ZM51_FUSOX|nr:hypothetical protein FOMG_14519 [Fusarium oxysporum f. sp. melonis 26406]